MGKKDKKKEKDVGKEIVKDKKKKSKVVKSEDGIPIITAASAIILIGIAIYGYTVYQDLAQVPEMPELDLNVWWGQNTTEPQDTSIRPYRIVFSDAMESEIRWLFEMYRRPNKKKSFEDTAWNYGVHSEAFAQFFSYWIFKYSFIQRPKFLNKFDHFKTNIQGLDIHYIHVKPNVDANTKVLPLLLLHGWPGSVREFYEAIPLLTTKREGYDFVFEVIVPSLPGFVFSEAPARRGLSPHQMAIIMRNLMHRIGHKQYYVQGGDFGHAVGSNIATIFPNDVLGFHTNLPVNFSKLAYLTWVFGSVWPTFVAGEHVDKLYPFADKVKFLLEEFGYMHLQSTKPDTVGIALQDSPAGLAAYVLDKFMIFTDPANKNDPEGGVQKYFTYDKLLDNIMLHWISGSIATSMRLYKECIADAEVEQVFSQIPTPVPTWGLRFKHELAHSPDFVLKWKYPNLVGTTNVDFGGHFAAFERPEEFSSDVFKAVKAFLSFKK
ncbi:juvenile hormone epoxide hydrolase-like isoform X2 [Anticarsia gemmatalis]|uniref:juvenile hormone epoxide hydrolase-like isoform X2 n=1 Tax=Anticarsia gemmatalis TaxID=129554 RepID=UPI003F75A4E2